VAKIQRTWSSKPGLLEVVIPRAVLQELKDLPEPVRNQFLVNLEMVRVGLDPDLSLEHLTSVGQGVIELKINGRPAFRLVYTTKIPGKILVVAARAKTANGVDRKLIGTVKRRLKSYTGG
jgi:phage-related protein